jgi:hypothetical protein
MKNRNDKLESERLAVWRLIQAVDVYVNSIELVQVTRKNLIQASHDAKVTVKPPRKGASR